MTAYANTDTISIDNLPLSSRSLAVTGSVSISEVVQVTGSVVVEGFALTASITPDRSSISTTLNVTASLASQIAMFSNPSRLGGMFFNTFSSKGNAYLSFGPSASTGSFFVALRPGAYYSMDTVSTELVSFIFDGTPGNLMITEQA